MRLAEFKDLQYSFRIPQVSGSQTFWSHGSLDLLTMGAAPLARRGHRVLSPTRGRIAPAIPSLLLPPPNIPEGPSPSRS